LSKTVLSNGVEMPWFGLGVFKVEEGPELVEAIKSAIPLTYSCFISVNCSCINAAVSCFNC
jgi:diketogulonate reductase-like aldo/keto reductase